MAVGQLSLYGAQQLLALAFGQTTIAPDNWYFALTTALATPDMDGSEISEPGSGLNYSRLKIPNDSVHWTTSPNMPYVMNAQTAWWPATGTVGATSDWPTCPGWALCDALTGGNVWAFGSLAVPVATPSGFCAYLAAGSLSLELSPFYSIASSS